MTFASLLGSALCGACAAAAEPIAAGRYCLKDELVADTGRGTFPMGNFQMTADVEKAGDGYRVAFQNSMPDNQEILTGDEDARVQPDGSLVFDFEDGWGNLGRGRLSPRGVMTLDVVKASPDAWGRNIQRNYGTFELSRGACADPIFVRR